MSNCHLAPSHSSSCNFMAIVKPITLLGWMCFMTHQQRKRQKQKQKKKYSYIYTTATHTHTRTCTSTRVQPNIQWILCYVWPHDTYTKHRAHRALSSLVAFEKNGCFYPSSWINAATKDKIFSVWLNQQFCLFHAQVQQFNRYFFKIYSSNF